MSSFKLENVLSGINCYFDALKFLLHGHFSYMNASCVCLATSKCVFETCVNLENRKNDMNSQNRLI